MATRKSKTIRANPLDAISAVSMEKVKAPIKSAPIKNSPIKNSRIKKSTDSLPGNKMPESVVEDKSVAIANNEPKTRTKTVTKTKKVSVVSASTPSAVSANTPEIACADVNDADQPCAAPEQSHTESKPVKKCAEDVFAQELNDLPAGNKESLMPDLPPEAFSEINNPQARLVIKQWAQWSAVGSMVPAPFMGTILISAAQIKMIHALCKSYDVPFERNLAVAVATGLVGGGVASGLAQLLGRIAIKTVPYLGAVFTLAVEPALSYASSYAIGMSFVKHFEAGGTLENFNAREMKSYFSENVARCLAYLRDRKKNIFASKSVQL